ncbi:MAG: flagellin [Pseudomonadota bacterium]
MTVASLGDLAHSFVMRRQTTQLKNEVVTIVQELASGQSSDLANQVRGDLNPLTSIEHDLSRLEAFNSSTTESALFATTLQSTLGVVQDVTQELAAAFVTTGSSRNGALLETAGTNAYETFKTAIAALNASVGGRSLLSGAATDTSPMASADDILDALEIAVASATTPNGVIAAAGAWFSATGDYDTIAYQGSATPLAPIPIGDGREANFSITALDDRIKETLKPLAMAALVDRGTLTLDVQEQLELIGEAGLELSAAQSGLSALRGDVGAIEATIEDARQSNETEIFGLEFARAEITEIDPYERATQLESAQSQLEALYAITARLSRLSLSDYL